MDMPLNTYDRISVHCIPKTFLHILLTSDSEANEKKHMSRTYRSQSAKHAEKAHNKSAVKTFFWVPRAVQREQTD
jgi:hypothetical protein